MYSRSTIDTPITGTMSDSITVTSSALGADPSTPSVPAGMTSESRQHAVVSTDGKGHDKISVKAGIGATLASVPPTPIYADTARPTWLPQNFKNPEALVQSQKEAQATITRLSQELALLKGGAATTPASTPSPSAVATPSGPVAPPAPTTSVAEPSTALQAGFAAGSTASPDSPPAALEPTPTPAPQPEPVDLLALSAEWAANGGKLTATSEARLAKHGIGKAQVEQFIEAQTALADKYAASLAQVAGGSDRLPLVLEWHALNNPQAAARYNQALAASDIQGARLILAGMSASYTDAVGRDPRLAIGGVEAGRMVTEQPFASMAELQAAQSDPRYRNGTDPAYIRSVERRGLDYARRRRGGSAM